MIDTLNKLITLITISFIVLGLFFIITMKDYLREKVKVLQDQVKIEAETESAKCFIDMHKALPYDFNDARCENIKDYKIRTDTQK